MLGSLITLHRDDHDRVVPEASAANARISRFDVRFIDLDRAGEQLAPGQQHRTPKLGQPRLRGLVAAQPERTLKPERRHALGFPYPRNLRAAIRRLVLRLMLPFMLQEHWFDRVMVLALGRLQSEIAHLRVLHADLRARIHRLEERLLERENVEDGRAREL
jgi:hypothetical protein